MGGSDDFVTLHSGAKMPKIGLGTWAPTTLVDKDQHDPQLLAKAVRVAIEAGYRHIDTAWAYFNEKEIGEVLKDLFQKGVVKREELFVTSKLYSFHHDPLVVEGQLRSQLAALQLDYLDLFLVHGPMPIKADPKEPRNIFPLKNGKLEFDHVDHMDTWKALEECVRQGLVRHIGLSNFNAKQIQRILDHCDIKPAVLQAIQDWNLGREFGKLGDCSSVNCSSNT